MRKMTIVAIATMLAAAPAFGQSPAPAGSGPAPADAIPVAIIGVVLVITGLIVARRARGWRIWAGLFAWFLIAISIGHALNQVMIGLDRAFPWPIIVDSVEPALLVLAAGYFVLWAKRREPRQNTQRS